MSKAETARTEWREARRRSARADILAAAWTAVRENGLAALSMRDLAARAGITTPTLYAYFTSKNDIYDAMFGQAAREFEAHMAAPVETDDATEALREDLRRFVTFATSDLTRHQLLFQRTIPGFEPSRQSYEPSVRALALTRDRLAAAGITDPRHLDMLTALGVGLVDQQIANDPGGDRWIRLIDDFFSMFLAHCRPAAPSANKKGRTP